tara:strand:+ start:204 stop:776 length:573 start_codon:yes stop_codon:yes gene_type:complete
MNCLNCNNQLINTIYKCTENDFRLEKTNGDLIYIKGTHNLDIDNEEVNTQELTIYCTQCEKLIDYPTTYDTINNKFKNGDFIMEEYHGSLNIIHQFTDINCSHCNNILKKGYFTNTEMEQNEENSLKYSYPSNFRNTIHIYDEETKNKIKDIEIALIELDMPETDIGKKIIYCPDCNYFIVNNLKQIYKS